jgi:hypothetical protein
MCGKRVKRLGKTNGGKRAQTTPRCTWCNPPPRTEAEDGWRRATESDVVVEGE